MQLNRIQQQIFQLHCRQLNMKLEYYIEKNAEAYIHKKCCSSELTEEDGDIWIEKLYLESLQRENREF